MSAHYRVKEAKHMYTPQRRVLGMWVRMARPQPTMEAASQIIRDRIRSKHGPAPVRGK